MNLSHSFSAYFQVRNLHESDDFDADTGVNHEHTTVKDESGEDHPVDVWTTCLTPRELRLMAASVGLDVDAVYSVRPGRYGAAPPAIDTEEFLLLATRPRWDLGATD